ncbi:MAG TPA: hypothetical protein VIE65_12810 [Methylobacter sp.]|jgi:hypothetical protein
MLNKKYYALLMLCMLAACGNHIVPGTPTAARVMAAEYVGKLFGADPVRVNEEPIVVMNTTVVHTLLTDRVCDVSLKKNSVANEYGWVGTDIKCSLPGTGSNAILPSIEIIPPEAHKAELTEAQQAQKHAEDLDAMDKFMLIKTVRDTEKLKGVFDVEAKNIVISAPGLATITYGANKKVRITFAYDSSSRSSFDEEKSVLKYPTGFHVLSYIELNK